MNENKHGRIEIDKTNMAAIIPNNRVRFYLGFKETVEKISQTISNGCPIKIVFFT